MQLMFDHISAILVAGAVTILLISTSLRAQQAAVEETIAYAAKAQTLNLADFLEDDLLMIGDGTTDTIEDVETNADGQTTLFSFWKDDEFGVDMLVAYTLTEQDSIYIAKKWVQLYQLNRFENGDPAGGGSSTLEAFQITMLNVGGNATASVSAARLVRVRVVTVYPFGDPDKMSLFRNYWGITIRPPNLGS